MHPTHIPQCSIQNRNVYISVLNGALWDMGQVDCGIGEFGSFGSDKGLGFVTLLSWTPRYKYQWNLDQNTFSHINIFGNVVCTMSVILFE